MSSYDLLNNNSFKRKRVNSVWHSTELVSCLDLKIWDIVPNEMLSNSKSKDGSLNDIHAEYAKYILGK